MKRTLAIAISFCAASAVVWLATVLFFTHSAATPHSWTERAAKLLPAAREYAKLLRTEGFPVPAYVGAKQLVTRGLLDLDDLKAFDGMDVSVSTSQDPGRLDDVLIQARQPDGTDMVLLVDGSVHTR